MILGDERLRQSRKSVATRESGRLINLCRRQPLDLTPAPTLLESLRIEQGLLFGIEVLVGGLDSTVTYAGHDGDVLGCLCLTQVVGSHEDAGRGDRQGRPSGQGTNLTGLLRNKHADRFDLGLVAHAQLRHVSADEILGIRRSSLLETADGGHGAVANLVALVLDIHQELLE